MAMHNTLVVTVGYLVGIIFLILAVVYFTTPADHLLHFMPGYAASSSTHHVKHALACLGVAIIGGLVGWFAGGPQQPSAPQQ
jgi:hypothetical protein